MVAELCAQHPLGQLLLELADQPRLAQQALSILARNLRISSSSSSSENGPFALRLRAGLLTSVIHGSLLDHVMTSHTKNQIGSDKIVRTINCRFPDYSKTKFRNQNFFGFNRLHR
jgi:hypothetical protein